MHSEHAIDDERREGPLPSAGRGSASFSDPPCKTPAVYVVGNTLKPQPKVVAVHPGFGGAAPRIVGPTLPPTTFVEMTVKTQ